MANLRSERVRKRKRNSARGRTVKDQALFKTKARLLRLKVGMNQHKNIRDIKVINNF